MTVMPCDTNAHLPFPVSSLPSSLNSPFYLSTPPCLLLCCPSQAEQTLEDERADAESQLQHVMAEAEEKLQHERSQALSALGALEDEVQQLSAAVRCGCLLNEVF